MTKKDIVKTIATELNVSQTLAHEIVQRTFDGIIDALLAEKRIELRNFGVFEVKLRAARKARNPRTNERVDVPSRVAVTFKPGKEMAKKIAQLSVDDVKSSGAEEARPAERLKPPVRSEGGAEGLRPDARPRT